MARKLITLLAASAGALVAAPTASAELHSREWGERFAQGEALVRFEPGVVAAERREAREDAAVEFEESLLVPRLQVVRFDGSVKAAIARLERQPGVAYAQPNFRYHTLAVSNDTHAAQLWGLEPTPGVGVAAAWPRTQGAGQVIAVVDTGVDITHPDLLANLWSNPGEVPGNGVDDDSNGMADDFRGRDFVHNDGDPSDHENHGTHVSGTAAAVANNGLGVAGVAPAAQIMAVRVLDGNGSGMTSDIANGIAYATNEGAGVINLSLGAPAGGEDGAMQNAIALAGTRGTVVVAAAGNDSSNNDVAPTSPCNLPNENLICVAAVDDGGNLASYSNFGRATVDVAAPGGDFDPGEQEILSTKPSWGVPVFSEGFEGGTGAWTSTTNALAWGVDDVPFSGAQSAADSPNAAYQPNTLSRLDKSTPIDSLAGKQGCRMHFSARLNVNDLDVNGNPLDFVGVGVVSGAQAVGQDFWGSTFTSFMPIELTISDLDGRSDVTPSLRFTSNGSNQQDGAYIDDLRIFCRASDYNDVVVPPDDFELAAGSGGGSYMAISGTSMATPHVSGVAALVRATDPGAPPAQVVQAIREGAKPSGDLALYTASGGAVDAAGAMDRALALSNPSPPPPPPPPPPPAPPTAPAKARFGSVSVNRRGVVTLRLFGNPGTTGVLTLRAEIVRPRIARLVRVARKTFRIGSTGRATVKPRLTRAALRQLRRTRRLRVRATVVLKNAAGLTSTSRARLRLRLRRR
jgi:thermitase